jgi:hypothetical protein
MLFANPFKKFLAADVRHEKVENDCAMRRLREHTGDESRIGAQSKVVDLVQSKGHFIGLKYVLLIVNDKNGHSGKFLRIHSETPEQICFRCR